MLKVSDTPVNFYVILMVISFLFGRIESREVFGRPPELLLA